MATRRRETLGRVEQALALGAKALAECQGREEGSFDLGFDGGALPDAHLVIVARLLSIDLGDLPARLVRRLLDRQLADGGWALAPGMAGHLSTAVEAYVALRAAGLDQGERALRRARGFIEAAGGLEAARGPTRVTLALLGLQRWPELMIPPPELALLPAEAPVSLFRVGALLRLHLLPLLVLRAVEAVVAPELGLRIGQELGGGGGVRSGASARPGPLRGEALAACQRLMVERLDEDGTLGGLLFATGWAALAAYALGLPGDSQLSREAARGLRSFVYSGGGRETHAQVCRPTVRATALGLLALRRSGARCTPELERAGRYLRGAKAGERGDFELLGPPGAVVAWSIKPRSRRFPSLLDTLSVVRALDGLEGAGRDVEAALGWVASMQRPDGGFALFDRDAATAPWLRRLPLGLLSHTLNDDSSPEVTGRVLEATARRSFLEPRQIDRAAAFLGRSQRPDGSWQGPFSVGYLPATSAALAGLASVGAGSSAVARRAVELLTARQRPEGGWGESPDSVSLGGYQDLGRCSPAQTAQALVALIAAEAPDTSPAIERALSHLLWTQEPDGSWVDDDPTSASLSDVLHLRDPVERLAWPLLALAAYREVCLGR